MNDQKLTRRSAIVSATFVPIAALRSAAQTPNPPAPSVLEAVFGPDQRRLLEAVLNRLIPADQNGPGAVQCGAADYFERQLSGDLAVRRPQF